MEKNINRQSLDLIDEQLNEWEQAAKNYAGLESVKQREINFEGLKLYVQFNPERIASSAAKVDVQSIRERKCFLCEANRPPQQRGLTYAPSYVILINPFPIFKKHLTIPTSHVDQRIEGRMGDMLRLAKDLNDFVIFYNGPKSGASAPDHFHFQAGNKGMMPVESEFDTFKGKSLLYKKSEGEVWTMENYLRRTLVFTSKNATWLEDEFYRFLRLFAPLQPNEDEPMMNVLASYSDDEGYRLYVFPRSKHRPYQFFEEGDKQIVFSPGSVDFGGLLITPREEDYNKLTTELIADMLGQVTLKVDDWMTLKNKLRDAAL